MITQGKINLLNDVIIDRSLLKYIIVTETKESYSNIVTGNWGGGVLSSSSNSNVVRGNTHLSFLEYLYEHTPTLLLRLKILLYKKVFSKNFDIKQMKMTPVALQTFFDSIKTTVNELEAQHIDEVLNKYDTVLQNARYNNQIALVEKIVAYAEILKNELVLSTSSFKCYILEEEVVKFYNIASKHEKFSTGLCLTYIKNFTKIIPDEITALRREADKLRIFDNYVIMHYDYDGTAAEDTVAEKQKKKDPILFGVIQGSRNLYFIGDWVDEYCDLTLDIIIKKLGTKSIKELDTNTVIENIEKI